MDRIPLLSQRLILTETIRLVRQQLLQSAFNNLVRSPLRHIPGPLPAKLSKAWLLAFTLSGRRAFYLHALHQRYGPVVRVGPNDLSFASAAAARDILVGVEVDVDAATTACENATLGGKGKKAIAQ